MRILGWIWWESWDEYDENLGMNMMRILGWIWWESWDEYATKQVTLHRGWTSPEATLPLLLLPQWWWWYFHHPVFKFSSIFQKYFSDNEMKEMSFSKARVDSGQKWFWKRKLWHALLMWDFCCTLWEISFDNGWELILDGKNRWQRWEGPSRRRLCNVGDAETCGNNHFYDFCIPQYGSIDNL